MAAIGLRTLIWTPILNEVPGQMPTYGTGVIIGAGIQANVAFERNTSELYGDDAKIESDETITGGTIDTTVDDMTDAVRVAMLGNIKTADDEIDITNQLAPYGGLAYLRERVYRGEKSFQTVFIFKVQMNESNINATTRGSNTEYQTVPLTGKMLGVQPDSDMITRFIRRNSHKTVGEANAWLRKMTNLPENTATA